MRSLTFAVTGLLMVAAAVGCGQPFTLTGSTGSGGSSSSSSGSKGSSSSGVACTPGDLTSCTGPGEYCAATSPPSCLPCADIGQRFGFGTPKKIDGILPDNTENATYPRIGSSNGKPNGLYFTYRLKGGNQDTDIGQADPTMNFQQWMKGAAEGPTINTPVNEGGELWLPDGKAIMDLVGMVDTTKEMLLFHRVDNVAMTTGIYVSDGTATEQLLIPMYATTRNFNIAVAPKATPPRLWYVSNINKSTENELVTNTPGVSTAASIQVTLDNGCTASAPFNPWVDETGSWLLISSVYLDKATGCKTPSAISHLFYIDLKVPDISMLQAKPVFPMDKGADRTTPAMSPDLCVLYYTENNNGMFDVYSAVRQ